MDKSDLSFITKGIMRYFINKRKIRRGDTNKNKGKHSEKCYEYRQSGHYMNKYPMKKKKKARGGKRGFNKFKISWEGCNSNGKIEEEYQTAQMFFMAIEENEIFFSYYSNDECDSECDDDDIKSFFMKFI